ncbi:M20/M25/M40 family metallo-hydrolase [Arthrobacter sp. VKM Ac-2550]|uniref:M20/M25/M40 family metallo-hydrolase n=1 Tax=Crystallibacter permensis TaxID=1938888 RepID=UPI002227C252|nr:M20/M25/M40 family metallo-hydrolase [Arthrobacter sp. VKM Ac-2550]MCW2131477.1 Peptidase family M28 [Arthrobacter sp. VKM Ac-2550]
MKLYWRRRMIVVFAVLVPIVLLLALVLVTARAGDSGPQSQVPAATEPQVQDPTAYDHLKVFQAIADEHGDRATGTSGYEAAARYVEHQLAKIGYQSSRQYFTFERRGEDFESFNILAETETGREDNVIMLGAHLDGVRNSPAINDNASGAAALLEAAKELSQQDDPNNKVRFVWWGAEEFSKSPGSKHYVEDLAADDDGELDNIAAYLNFDMVASPNYVIGVYDARESDHRPRLEVPDGSRQIMEFFTDYFDSRDQPWVATGWNFDSDQRAFIEEGVAVGGLFTGGDERKSRKEANLFGGEAREPRDPNYHTSGDDISNVDQEALSIMTDAITHAATSLAEDSSALE